MMEITIRDQIRYITCLPVHYPTAGSIQIPDLEKHYTPEDNEHFLVRLHSKETGMSNYVRVCNTLGQLRYFVRMWGLIGVSSKGYYQASFCWIGDNIISFSDRIPEGLRGMIDKYLEIKVMGVLIKVKVAGYLPSSIAFYDDYIILKKTQETAYDIYL